MHKCKCKCVTNRCDCSSALPSCMYVCLSDYDCPWLCDMQCVFNPSNIQFFIESYLERVMETLVWLLNNMLYHDCKCKCKCFQLSGEIWRGICALQKLAFCKWTTHCGAIPKRYQITLTDLFLDCAQLVEWPPNLNSNSWVFSHFQITSKRHIFFASTWLTNTNTYLFYLIKKKKTILATCTVLD